MELTTTPARNAIDEKPSSLDTPHTGTAERKANAATYMGESAGHAAAAVTQATIDAASYVGRKAEDAAAYVGQRSGDAGAAVGSGLRSLGNTVRERGPEEGMAGSASAAVADSLESSGRYLQEEGLKDMAEDVTNLIRRNPIPALLIGVAAGYLAGRAMTPRN